MQIRTSNFNLHLLHKITHLVVLHLTTKRNMQLPMHLLPSQSLHQWHIASAAATESTEGPAAASSSKLLIVWAFTTPTLSMIFLGFLALLVLGCFLAPPWTLLMLLSLLPCILWVPFRKHHQEKKFARPLLW